jgi:hypothetical protein
MKTILLQHFKLGSGMFHPRPVLQLFAAQVLCVLLRVSTIECKFSENLNFA